MFARVVSLLDRPKTAHSAGAVATKGSACGLLPLMSMLSIRLMNRTNLGLAISILRAETTSGH